MVVNKKIIVVNCFIFTTIINWSERGKLYNSIQHTHTQTLQEQHDHSHMIKGLGT